MSWRVGVDTGGTFTDVCLLDEESGRVYVAKVPSTPDDPSRAVLEGVRHAFVRVQGDDAALADIAYFAHGTTVGTNALLESKGARLGLITTEGFRDLLELGRQKRPRLYDLVAAKPVPLIDRELRLEVAERVLYDGSVDTDLDLDHVRARARELAAADVDGVVVCYLYSYLNPAHEAATRRILEEELPGRFISISHEVMPEFREYERLSTTVVNAYIGPKIQSYLGRLEGRLAEGGVPVVPHVTQSNGAVMSLATAQTFPVRTTLSGPSTGVVGAAALAEQSGYDRVITFDMGGTSTDVALVNDGRPSASPGMDLGGRPIRTAMLDINTVGAGGGSIAWVDAGGHLKVGPRSAGAVPGPACYGLGNTEPTVTDANVVLGIMGPAGLVGGDMQLDPSLSLAAVAALGDRLGLDPYQTAQGIISVVTANMARAIRVVSVQRGYDPTAYALVAFGGAGPLHAARLAAELGVERVLVPEFPGALSAMGMLMSDLRSDFSKTAITPLAAHGSGVIRDAFAELETACAAWFDEEGVDPADRSVTLTADVRYVGQNYEMSVVADGVDDAALERMRAAFDEVHERQHGYRTPSAPAEIVTFRAVAEGSVQKARMAPDFSPRDGSLSPVAHRDVYFPEFGGTTSTAVYERADLRPGDAIVGPAVIEQYDSTCLVLPAQTARFDVFGMLQITDNTEEPS